MATFLKLLRKIVSLLADLLCSLMLVLATIIVLLKATGYNFFTVQTGSMVDVYPVGTIILVKPVEFESIQSGDVISYYVANNTVVTHRVVSVDVQSERFTTKGDTNNSPDSNLVEYTDVIGKPILSVKYVGYLYLFAKTTEGKCTLVALLISAIVCSTYTKPNRNELREDDENES